jgi:Uncharacterised nucleotidyltransferase
VPLFLDVSEAVPARLFVLCARPDPGPETRAEASRLAAEVRDWDRVLAQADAEGLLPLLYWGLRDVAGAVPAQVLESLRRAFLKNLARNTQLFRELEPVLEAIRRAGLRVALTKGGRLAVDVYPDLALRPFWDVDFIVHPADWAPLLRLLDGLGFAEPSAGAAGDAAGPKALDWTYSPYFKKGPLFLEFHAHPLGLHFPSRDADGFWPSAGRLPVRGTEALVLPAENELCYLAVHAQQHSYSRLVWLADIAALAARPGLDWDWIGRIAGEARIRGPVHHGLLLAETLWPGTVPPEHLAAFRPGPVEAAGLRWLWSASAVARRVPAPDWPYYMPSLFSLWERKDPVLALRTVAEILFPPKAWLASASGVATGSPRLYGRYIERLFRPAVTAARRLLRIE